MRVITFKSDAHRFQEWWSAIHIYINREHTLRPFKWEREVGEEGRCAFVTVQAVHHHPSMYYICNMYTSSIKRLPTACNSFFGLCSIYIQYAQIQDGRRRPFSKLAGCRWNNPLQCKDSRLCCPQWCVFCIQSWFRLPIQISVPKCTILWCFCPIFECSVPLAVGIWDVAS